MDDSILLSIKKMLGIEQAYTHFDPDLIMHINSVFSILVQMGAGPSSGFKINSDEETWSDFITDMDQLQLIKTYINLKVRMIFDPPTSSIIADVYRTQISELEWRISTLVD